MQRSAIRESGKRGAKPGFRFAPSGLRNKETKMLITNVRAHHLRIPYDAGVARFRHGASATKALDIVVVEVSTDGGVTGWGTPSVMFVHGLPAQPSTR
jgi:hypothetical protein